MYANNGLKGYATDFSRQRHTYVARLTGSSWHTSIDSCSAGAWWAELRAPTFRDYRRRARPVAKVWACGCRAPSPPPLALRTIYYARDGYAALPSFYFTICWGWRIRFQHTGATPAAPRHHAPRSLPAPFYHNIDCSRGFRRGERLRDLRHFAIIYRAFLMLWFDDSGMAFCKDILLGQRLLWFMSPRYSRERGALIQTFQMKLMVSKEYIYLLLMMISLRCIWLRHYSIKISLFQNFSANAMKNIWLKMNLRFIAWARRYRRPFVVLVSRKFYDWWL